MYLEVPVRLGTRLQRLGCPSLQNLYLGIKRRGNLERRNARSLEVGVEKVVQAVRCYGKLATSVDSDHAQPAQRPHHDMALQQRSVVTEQKMICAADGDLQPSAGRQV